MGETPAWGQRPHTPFPLGSGAFGVCKARPKRLFVIHREWRLLYKELVWKSQKTRNYHFKRCSPLTSIVVYFSIKSK